jgi:hypothetical protein
MHIASWVQRGMHACAWALPVVALTTTGCSASSDYMRPLERPRAIQPKPDAATIVFIRHSGMAAGIVTTILDGRGRFLGDSTSSSYFATHVPPGQHVFIAWAENTAALRADVAAGKTYYIEVSPSMGALSARMHLLAITPKSESWPKRQEWMGDSTMLEANEPAGQAYLRGRGEDVAERIRRANEAIKGYSPEDLAERTIGPADGT